MAGFYVDDDGPCACEKYIPFMSRCKEGYMYNNLHCTFIPSQTNMLNTISMPKFLWECKNQFVYPLQKYHLLTWFFDEVMHDEHLDVP